MKPALIASIVTFVMLLSFINVALGEHPLNTMFFYGTSLMDGNPTPSGTIIEARIDDEFAGKINTTNEGLYGGPDPMDGKLIVNSEQEGVTINFFMKKPGNNPDYVQASESVVFSHGEIIELSLTFPGWCGDGFCSSDESCSSCPEDCGSCPPSPPSGGSGGGGGGGGGAAPACKEDWSCSEWSSCSEDGTQARECEDLKKCGTEKSKPPESQACELQSPEELPTVCNNGVRVCAGNDVMECTSTGNEWIKIETCELGCENNECVQEAEEPEEEEAQPTGIFTITGFFAENPVQAIFGTAVIAIILLGALIYWRARKA